MYNLLTGIAMGKVNDSVNISELRANLLNYLKKVQQGEVITVTSNGQMLATLMPPVGQHEAAKASLQALAKTAVIHDVIGPVNEDWEAMQ